MNNSTGSGTTQDFFIALQSRAAARSQAVQKLSSDLLIYQNARTALDGPALADWTARYEETLGQLVEHAVDGINDVFDSGSWNTALKMISQGPTSENAEDLMKRVQSLVSTDFGLQAAASLGALTTVLAGTTISSAASSDGVRITFSRDGQQVAAFGLSEQRATGDVARKSFAAIRTGRPPLTVERSNGLRQRIATGNDLGAIDFYGAFMTVCAGLLGNARREVRATERYGRVRVRGEAPILIALAVWAIIVGVLWSSYALACTGAIISSNAPNQETNACKILEGVATFISIIGIFIVVGLGTASNNFSSSATGGVTFNLND